MLKTGIENLKDGMKVVVEDMSKVKCGYIVGESGQVLTITRKLSAGGDGWRLLNPETGVYMYISPDEYKYVKVLDEGEDMEGFKVGDVVEIIAENDPYGFTGDHDIELGTKVTITHHDTADNTYLVREGEWRHVWAEPQAMKKVEDLANCDKLVEKYPEGTLLKCLVDDLEWYSKGEVYKVGYCDAIGTDYGVIDEDGQVMMEATIYDYAWNETGDFNPTQWEVVELEKVKVEDYREMYPEGTKLRCLDPDFIFYFPDKTYEVGEDNDGDYGVKDKFGDVMLYGRMYSENDLKLGFDPKRWEVVEPEEVEVEEPKQEPKFKVGDIVVRARNTGGMATFYPIGTVMEVKEISPTGTYWCEGYTPHTEALGQYVLEEDLELASIEDIKKLTQEFVEKSREDNSEEAPDINYILTDVHNQIEQIRRMCTALDYKVALTLAELDDK